VVPRVMGYIIDARTRAASRRSRWNLLLIPCYALPWLLLTFASVFALGKAYGAIHRVQVVGVLPDTVGGVLMAVGSLFAWLGPAMIGANLLVATIPPARRALDREASSIPGGDRAAANRSLLRLSCYVTPAGIVVALAGLVVGL
jgi:hypothetical protein